MKKIKITKTNSNFEIVLLFDNEDYAKAKEFTWYSRKQFPSYNIIYTKIDKKQVSINKIVFELSSNFRIYHKNNNPYDFRKDKILFLSNQEFKHATSSDLFKNKCSKYYGVYWSEHSKRWRVRVIKGKEYCGGSYKIEKEAGIVSEYIRIQLYGDLTKKNFRKITFSQLEEEYNKIKEKYGKCKEEVHSKSIQGASLGKKGSNYVGVYARKSGNRFYSEISCNKKRYYLGSFDNKKEAAKAYDEKALELYGENAKCNFNN